jgi:hypothetical protein
MWLPSNYAYFMNKVCKYHLRYTFHLFSSDLAVCVLTESHPDRWFRKSFFEYIDVSRELIARFIGAGSEGLVLLESASTAFNSIVRSMAYEVGL